MMHQITQPRYHAIYNYGERNGGYHNNYGSTANEYAYLRYGTRKYRLEKQPPTKSKKYKRRDTTQKQVVKDQNGNPNFRISSAKGRNKISASKNTRQNSQIPRSTNSHVPTPPYNPYYGGAKAKNSANIIDLSPSQASENTPHQRFNNLESKRQRLTGSLLKPQGKQTGYQHQYEAKKGASMARHPLKLKPPLAQQNGITRPNQPVKAHKGEIPSEVRINLENMGSCWSKQDIDHGQQPYKVKAEDVIDDMKVQKQGVKVSSSRGNNKKDNKKRTCENRKKYSNTSKEEEPKPQKDGSEVQDSYRKRQMKSKNKKDRSKVIRLKKKEIEPEHQPEHEPAKRPKIVPETVSASQRGQTLERWSNHNMGGLNKTSIREAVKAKEERKPFDDIKPDLENQKQSVREERNPYHSRFQAAPLPSEYHDEEMPLVTKPKCGISQAPARAKFAMLDSGLPNLGNTCYMNSTLQALSPLAKLIPFLETLELDFNSDGPSARQEFDVLWHFCRVMEHLRDESFNGGYRCLKSLYREMNKAGFHKGYQDDSHRFFNFMFDKINDYKQAFPQIELGQIPFKMTIKHVSECCEEGCDFTQESEETAYCLTLPVQRDSLKANLNLFYLPKEEHNQECVKCSFRHTLVEAEHQIDIMTENMEYLKGRKRANLEKEINVVFEQANLINELLNWKWFKADKALREFNTFCRQPGYQTKCIPYMKVCTTQTERKVIESLPETLCIHLNRSSVQIGRTICKDQKFIKFPTSFDSEKFMTDCRTSANYVLRSTIIHEGETNSGHYYSHRQELPKRNEASDFSTQNSASKKWVSASDSNVREIELSQVKKASAYMLFYERE